MREKVALFFYAPNLTWIDDVDFMRSVLSSRTGKLHTPGKWLEVQQILDTLISKKKKKKEKRKTVSSPYLLHYKVLINLTATAHKANSHIVVSDL